MKAYRPSYIMLCGQTLLDQCLSDKCENCEQLLKTLIALGLKHFPVNCYATVDLVVCLDRHVQAGSGWQFPKLQCILGECTSCGGATLEEKIRSANRELFNCNRTITWQQWAMQKGKSGPKKIQLKGTLV